MTMQETRSKSGGRKTKERSAKNDQPAVEAEESIIESPPAPGPPQVSALAIIALVMASLGILLIPGLIGLVTGIVALWQIEESRGRLLGREIAISAICLSLVMLVLCWITLLILSTLGGIIGGVLNGVSNFFGKLF